ncbi:MAG TPA: alpha-2-macroglobulin family protein, partial [Isosphaeraceae bacterium]|nr:alpha-2-macroglobulin family protein [Isosphaeraceae bacterium]
FEIGLTTSRDVYLDGESFQLQVVTTDARGEPAGHKLSAALLKLVESRGNITEREIQRKPLETDHKTGRGSLSFRVDDTQGGRYVVRVAGTDRFDNPIVADRFLTISGKKDETKLRLLADRQRYKVGEEARINLHSRDRAGTALVTWEADRILSYKIITLKEGDNAIAWEIAGVQFPNFTLTATRMWHNESNQAKLDIQVERDLRVTVVPTKPVVGPGEQVELEVATVDQLGRPVSAELSIAMVDQSLLRLFDDRLPAIGPFFYNQTRTGAFATEATNTFCYAPATISVSQAVVDEADRLAAVARNSAELGRVMEEAKSTVLRRESAPASVLAGATEAREWAAQLPGAPLAKSKNGRADRQRRYGKSVQLFSSEGVEKLGELKDKDLKKHAAADFLVDNWAEQFGEIQSRERFVETAYWNPKVVTGTDGKARVTFKAPTALSGYRITARGVTGADTLAGQTTAALTVRKNFFVELKLPSALTQGDKPRFVARVHHSDVAGKLALRLAIYAGGRDEIFPGTLDIKQDGIDEVSFEPFLVPEGDSVRLTLTGTIGERTDEVIAEAPIRPWGVRVAASESGTSSESTTVFVGLPAGRSYESSEMQLVLSPTLERMVIELALGQEAYVLGAGSADPRPTGLLSKSPPGQIWPPCNTTSDRAADLLAATAALQYVKTSRATAAPEAARLTQRIGGLVSSLISAQNEDGGWPWVSGGPLPRSSGKQQLAASERLASAAVVWALASAQPLGLVTDVKVLDHAGA